MEIKVKKPQAVKLNLDEKSLTVAQTVKRGLKRVTVADLVPLAALTELEIHQPTADTDGHFLVKYQADKKSPAQSVEFWFGASDAPFIAELQVVLEAQISKNGEWGEAEFVANGQLIMEYLAMRDQGLLTNAEFEAKKREILRLD